MVEICLAAVAHALCPNDPGVGFGCRFRNVAQSRNWNDQNIGSIHC
jgi:hypothetical protein